MTRKVLNINDCMKTFEGDGIPVTRAFPVPEMREFDPFLLFDHFGPINYEPGGATVVPAHPHCGFEGITYLLGGEVEHKDSWGGKATIRTGDVQWMTTGSDRKSTRLNSSHKPISYAVTCLKKKTPHTTKKQTKTK